MKNAKFVIMLQVCFLIGIFVFSASAVYQPEQIAPCAIANLAVRQPGYEPALPEHDAYQARLSSMDSMARAAKALKDGDIPENAQKLDIPSANMPVYLVSFTDNSDKSEFLVVMSASDKSGAISDVISKNEPLSTQLGVFVGLPPRESIENLLQVSRTSSAGITEALVAISPQLEEYKESGNPYILQDALRRLSEMGPAAEMMLPDLEILRDNEIDPILQASIEITMQKILPSDILEKTSSSGYLYADADLDRMIERFLDPKTSMWLLVKTARNIEGKGINAIPLLVKSISEATDQVRRMFITGIFHSITDNLKANGKDPETVFALQIQDTVSELEALEAALREENKDPNVIAELGQAIGQAQSYIASFEQAIEMLAKSESLVKTSSSGLKVDEEAVLILISQWQSPELAVREAAVERLIEIRSEARGMFDNMAAEGTISTNDADRMKTIIDNAINIGAQIQPRDISDATSAVSSLDRDSYNAASGLFDSLSDMNVDLSKINNAKLLVAQSRLANAEGKLTDLQKDLLAAKTNDRGAKETVNGQPTRNTDVKGSSITDAKVVELEKEIIRVELEKIRLENTIISLDAQQTIKQSSAGYEKDIAKAMAYLSGSTYAFTGANTMPELNADMLLRQIGACKETINKLEEIKSLSPDAAIAVAEQASQVQASLDTMTAVQSIVAEDALLPETTGTIVINDKDIPANQKILLTMLDKSNPYLEALQTKLGCQVRLLSQYNAKIGGKGHTIVISSKSVEDISRRIDIQSVTQDGYLPLEQVIVLAKGLLGYSQDTKPVLNGIISQMYRFITKSPLSPKLLEAFLKNSVFILDLPMPVAIDEAYYEQLHRQALAALIAA